MLNRETLILDEPEKRKPILLLMQRCELGPKWFLLKLGARKRMWGDREKEKGHKTLQVSGGATGTISVVELVLELQELSCVL